MPPPLEPDDDLAALRSVQPTVLQHHRDFLARQQLLQLFEKHGADAGLLVVFQPAHFTDPLAAVLFDHLVLDPGEDLHVDDDTFHAGRDFQRRILHVLGFLTEDRRQQLFFG